MHDGQTSTLKSEARSSRKTISHRRSSGSKLSGQAALPGAFGSTTPTGPGADHRLNGEGKPHRKTGSSSVSKAPDWLATRKVSGASQRSKSGSTTGLAGRSTTDRPPATDPTGPTTGHRARSVTPVTDHRPDRSLRSARHRSTDHRPGRSSRPTSHRSGRAIRPAGHRPPVT